MYSSVLGRVYGYNSDGVDTDKGYKENNDGSGLRLYDGSDIKL